MNRTQCSAQERDRGKPQIDSSVEPRVSGLYQSERTGVVCEKEADSKDLNIFENLKIEDNWKAKKKKEKKEKKRKKNRITVIIIVLYMAAKWMMFIFKVNTIR